MHLVGVGGVGMSGLARLLLTRGIPTSGSELREWPQLAALKALGGTIFRTHQPSNLDGVDTVVYSTAIPQDHIELVTARERGLRLMHRSEALAATMVGRRSIAVAGTHGKTTTTSMITLMLQHAGLDPSFVIGGEISEVGSNAHHGSGELFVAEADESDRSFLLYNPHVAVVTNIDADHLNTYGDLQGLEDAFVEFCAADEPGGFVVTCADDPGAQRMTVRVRAAGGDVVTYGTRPRRRPAPVRGALLRAGRAVRGAPRRRAARRGVSAGPRRPPRPQLGRGAAHRPAAGHLRGVGDRGAGRVPRGAAALRVQGRRGRRADLRRVRVSPGPDGAAMRTLREVAAGGRLIVVFQPYRMYRTRDFQAEIAAALSLGDEAIVMEVFGPGEVREPGEGGVALTAAVDLPEDRKVFVPSWEDVPGEVVARVREGDVVVTMGAPPISLMGDELLAALQGRRRRLRRRHRPARRRTDRPDPRAAGGSSWRPRRARRLLRAAVREAGPAAPASRGAAVVAGRLRGASRCSAGAAGRSSTPPALGVARDPGDRRVGADGPGGPGRGARSRGTPLARLDLGAVERRVRALKPVRDRQRVEGLPAHPVLAVRERTASPWCRGRSASPCSTRAAWRTCRSAAPAGLPVLRIAAPARATPRRRPR